MMAPYSIAHMKIGLKLFETGYRFDAEERARIYLTNSLEPRQDFSDTFEPMVPALAHEAQAVNAIKQHQRFSVIIGNPPYSGHSWNLTPQLRLIVEPYRYIENKRIREKGALQLEKSIQEDYIKFIRYGQMAIEGTSIGAVGLVTSHGFLDNPTLRGMRYSLLNTFRDIFVVDLHGNVSRREVCPDGTSDHNVFDIKKTGACISLLVKMPRQSNLSIRHSELWGQRDTVKYPWLQQQTIMTASLQELGPRPPLYLFVPQDLERLKEYEAGHSIATVMPIHSKGVVTGRDAFVTDFDKVPLLERMRAFATSDEPDEILVERFGLNPSDWWRVDEARRKMPPVEELSTYLKRMLYRPFDFRFCFYHPAVFMSPRRPVMKNFDMNKRNYLLATSRMTKGELFRHILVTDGLAEAILLSSKTSNNAIIFPLYLISEEALLSPNGERDVDIRPNMTKEFISTVCDRLDLRWVDTGRGDLAESVGPEDILFYFVSILHSPSYRAHYSEFLKRDFPRIPLTSNRLFFQELCGLGSRLVQLFFMESDVNGGCLSSISFPPLISRDL